MEGLPLPHLRSRKGLTVLALLSMRAQHPLERRWLAGQLWPDSPEEQALGNLRRTLTDLRRALGKHASCLQSFDKAHVSLDLHQVDVDVLCFDRLVGRADSESLRSAVALYVGPLLEGVHEEWVAQERHARDDAVLRALRRLAMNALAEGDHVAAHTALRRAIGIDRWCEPAYRQLMETLAASGDYASAIQVYRELRRLLNHELHIEPAPASTQLFAALRGEARRSLARYTSHGPVSSDSEGAEVRRSEKRTGS